MFMQSAAMALAFGSNFQYGKRKISSMSNDEFNRLTPTQMNIDLVNSVNAMIPSVEASFKQMERMNVTILDSMARYLAQGVEFLFDVVSGKKSIQGSDSTFSVDNILPNLGSLIGVTDPSQSGLQQSFADTAPSKKTSSTFGPIGPSLAKLDLLYAGMSITQLRKVRSSSVTWSRIPKTQRDLIQKILNVNPFKTPTQAIKASGASGVVKKISTMFAELVRIISVYRRTGRPLDRRNIAKQWLILAKKYNQFVLINKRGNLMVDTAKSLKLQKVIAKR